MSDGDFYDFGDMPDIDFGSPEITYEPSYVAGESIDYFGDTELGDMEFSYDEIDFGQYEIGNDIDFTQDIMEMEFGSELEYGWDPGLNDIFVTSSAAPDELKAHVDRTKKFAESVSTPVDSPADIFEDFQEQLQVNINRADVMEATYNATHPVEEKSFYEKYLTGPYPWLFASFLVQSYESKKQREHQERMLARQEAWESDVLGKRQAHETRLLQMKGQQAADLQSARQEYEKSLRGGAVRTAGAKSVFA